VTGARVFIGLGTSVPESVVSDGAARIERALAALDRDGLAVAAAGRCVLGPYEGDDAAAPVLNTVAELRTTLTPEDLLAHLRSIEAAAGRVRDGRSERTLDLDLLAYGEIERAGPGLTLPHPRFVERAFVLQPWEEIAPGFVVRGATVLEHAATLRHTAPERFDALEVAGGPVFATRDAACTVLADRAALRAWRDAQTGVVGVVPTMGALHAGHASLVQRASAECDAVVATLFVNPLQFAPGEDLERYPRNFQEDCALLARHGADAVYAPAADDLFPPGFTNYVEPGSAAEGYEGAERPTHFRGVATVVVQLWTRTRPDRGYFGRKDAQQLAVLRQVLGALDLPGEVVACPTVRAADGLALSSRNRYLAPDARRLATSLSAALEEAARAAARGERDCAALAGAGRAALEAAGLDVDYFDVVDPDRMTPEARLRGPALVVAAARLGDVRLLDNRWIAPASNVGALRAMRGD